MKLVFADLHDHITLGETFLSYCPIVLSSLVFGEWSKLVIILVFFNFVILFECNALFLFQDFQKDVVRAAEAFTAIGYKHIETGENLVYFLHEIIFII